MLWILLSIIFGSKDTLAMALAPLLFIFLILIMPLNALSIYVKEISPVLIASYLIAYIIVILLSFVSMV
jgi:hypothetical protein